MPAGARRPASPDDRPRIAVAASGGVDSTALLHAVVRQAAELGIQVHALHVHHGLQPEADRWLRHVRDQCRRWAGAGASVVFHAHRVLSKPPAGSSVEAWARHERYAALARMAHGAGCEIVLLAHHRRDQAETWLLQALRGGGPAGLAAMPREAEREGLLWIRPWLDQPRSAIEAYVARWRLRAVHDPSNQAHELARSRLRQRVWPSLLRSFPDAESSLAASARFAGEARTVLEEAAAEDLAALCQDGALVLDRWLSLSRPRRANALRLWLLQACGRAAPETLVQRLLDETPNAPAGRWPAPDGCVAVHLGRLHALAQAEPGVRHELTFDLSREGEHSLPEWGGVLRVNRVAEGGVPGDALCLAKVRARHGGEQFQAHPAGVPRALKKQFQDRGVPRWLRQGPIVESGGALVFVAGLGLDARALGWPGQPRVDLHWAPLVQAHAPFRARSVR